jgi:hypothetical protein
VVPAAMGLQEELLLSGLRPGAQSPTRFYIALDNERIFPGCAPGCALRGPAKLEHAWASTLDEVMNVNIRR